MTEGNQATSNSSEALGRHESRPPAGRWHTLQSRSACGFGAAAPPPFKDYAVTLRAKIVAVADGAHVTRFAVWGYSFGGNTRRANIGVVICLSGV